MSRLQHCVHQRRNDTDTPLAHNIHHNNSEINIGPQDTTTSQVGEISSLCLDNNEVHDPGKTRHQLYPSAKWQP